MGKSLLGLFLILYSIAVIFIAMKKPEKIWKMKKTQFFIKILKEDGTVKFFYAWGALFAILGMFLLVS